jgi:hypothetical protein
MDAESCAKEEKEINKAIDKKMIAFLMGSILIVVCDKLIWKQVVEWQAEANEMASAESKQVMKERDK